MESLSKLLKRYGIIKFICMAADEALHFLNKATRDILFHWTKEDFGLKEAIFWSKDIDQYLRYSKIIGEIKKIKHPNNKKKLKILDVGAGGEGIAKFLKYSHELNKYNIYLFDKDAAALSKVKIATPIVSKEKRLPFADQEFDIVVSLDTLEHIPKEERAEFLNELKRVGNNILLHFVMHDPDHNFNGRDGDFKFNQWYLKMFKKEHSWTAEHLQIEPPTFSEIQLTMPDASITGTQNTDIWFKYLTFSSTPIIGFFTGFVFMLKWKKQFNYPPFHGCFVKSIKS